jgi:hypothetical protein
MFGRLSQPESLVLIEDDFFDYMIGVTVNKDLIPRSVSTALTNEALLVLGLQYESWESRALFRFLMNQQGITRLRGKPHVAAQISPAEPQVLNKKEAEAYLQKYFNRGRISPNSDININIFWGTAQDFINELLKRLPAEALLPLPPAP